MLKFVRQDESVTSPDHDLRGVNGERKAQNHILEKEHRFDAWIIPFQIQSYAQMDGFPEAKMIHMAAKQGDLAVVKAEVTKISNSDRWPSVSPSYRQSSYLSPTILLYSC